MATNFIEQVENLGVPMLPISEVSPLPEHSHLIVINCPVCRAEFYAMLDGQYNLIETADRECECAITPDEFEDAINFYFDGPEEEFDPENNHRDYIDMMADRQRDEEF
jgi:hypothetical protein